MNRSEILGNAVKPMLKPIDQASIPNALKEQRRWILWNFVWMPEKNKWDKPPFGKWREPEFWSDFAVVLGRYEAGQADGIGFVLGEGWTGIDLDDCINGDGELTPLAHDVLATLSTYAEISPTGTGLKLICRGTPPKGSKGADGALEMYCDGRYFTVTGQHHSGDVAHRQNELEAVHAKYVAKKVTTSHATVSGVSYGALAAMLRIKPKPTENDGSNRLFAWACRAVEHNLSDEQAVATIRAAELEHPFPMSRTDADIIARVRDAEEKEVRGSARPSVFIGNDFPATVDATVAALAQSDIYQHLGQLTTIASQPPKCRYALDDNGAPRLAPVPRDGMLETLTRAADFVSFDGRSKTVKHCMPKTELRSAIHCRGEYPGVRVIHGVVCRPILLPNGDIVSTPGYHVDSGLFVQTDGVWPATVSTDEGIAKLRDVWSDFPFSSPASEAACFAALLTLLCRRSIPGNTPLFAFDGNRPAVGKGLLTDTLTAIGEGRRASRYSYSTQDELRKYLTSVAVNGSEYVLFDNLKGRFGGATLEAAMTGGKISDRILGRSETIELPLSITWLATGNGFTCSDDMARRTVPIIIDATSDRPGDRGDFKYADLNDHVLKYRRELLIAGLSIVSNFIKAGAPPQNIPAFGSFKAWSDLVRGCLVCAGLPDPLETQKNLNVGASDGADAPTKELLDAWKFPEPMTVKRAIEALADGDSYVELRSLLAQREKDVLDSEYLGKRLRSANGRVVDGRKLVHDGASVPKWRVVPVICA